MGVVARRKGAHFKGLRWVLLGLSVFGSFGSEYSFDIASTLKDMLQQHFANQASEEQFEILYSLMYSLMAFPNIIVPLILGILVDKYGVRINFAIMSIVVAIGVFIVYLGIQQYSFVLLFLGRMLSGATGESLHIIEGLFLREYFSSNRMSFVIAIIEAFLHLGGVVTAWVSPRLAMKSLGIAFGAAVLLCTFSATLICIACFIDRYVEKRNREIANEKEERRARSELLDFGDLDENYDTEEDPFLHLNVPELIHVVDNSPMPTLWERIKAYTRNIETFPSIYWFLAIAGAITLPSILSFVMISTSYITDKQNSHLSVATATMLSAQTSSIFRITAAISSPFLGYVIDRLGRRAFFMTAGVVGTFISHILIIFFNPVVCCILFGLSYALTSATVWPSIYVIVDKSMLGIATGLVNAMDNGGFFVYPIIVGLIKNKSGSYDYSQIFLAGLSFIASLAALKVVYMLHYGKSKKHVPRLTPVVSAQHEHYA